MGFSIFIASLLGLFSVVLILAFLKLALGPLIGDPRSFRDRFKLRRKKQVIERIDQLLQQNQLKQAGEGIRESFFLDPRRPDRALIDQIATHHLEALNRLVALSDRYSRHLSGLPLLEDLLLTRSDLLRSQFDVSQTRRELSARKLSSGHRSPDWARNEFSKKLLDITDRLTTNRRTIENQVRELLDSLHESPEPDHVTYH